MYAIIQDGGKQYKVTPGEFVDLEKKSGEKNSEVIFSEILLYNNGEKIEVGTPFISNLKIKGIVEKQHHGKKITIIKYRRCKDSRRKRGYRHEYTRVLIQEFVKE
jgi:large subunit ribosomal protein L21